MMMRKNKVIIWLITLILFQFNSIAQELDSKTRRTINFEIYNLLDEYERYGRLTDNMSYIVPEFKEKYKNVFSKDARVFCDIVLANKLDTEIDVDEYVSLTELFYPQGIGISLTVENISFPQHVDENSYSSIVKVKKMISGYSKYDIMLEDTFRLDIKIVYEINNKKVDKLKISKIEGPLSGKYINLALTGNNGKKALADISVDYSIGNLQKEITTNDEGKASIKNLASKDIVEFSISGNRFYKHKATLHVKDFIEKRDFNSKEDPNVYHINLKQKTWNAGFNIQLSNPGMDLGNNVYVDAGQSIDNTFNPGIGISAYINYLAGSIKNTDWGFGIGFMFSTFYVDSKLEKWGDSYSATDEMDRSYERTVFLSDIEESAELSTIEIPFSIFLRQEVSKKLYLTANIGISAGTALNAVSSSTAKGKFSGKYGPEWFNLEVSENGIGDYGNYDVENPEENELEFDSGISPFVDIGFEYAISDGLNIKIGGQFIQKSIELKKAETYTRLSSDSNNLNSTLAGYDALGFSKLNIYIGVSKDF
ncbi:MAG: hypothetical protein U9R19_14555 [Bacteroidota bacterium]|nr:hypothetical protein [Bacteroidota bacterium]